MWFCACGCPIVGVCIIYSCTSSVTMNLRCGIFALDACNHEMLFATQRLPIAKNQLQSIINNIVPGILVFIVVQCKL